MAIKTITDLTAATALDADDVFAVDEDTVTKKATMQQVTDAVGTLLTTVSNPLTVSASAATKLEVSGTGGTTGLTNAPVQVLTTNVVSMTGLNVSATGRIQNSVTWTGSTQTLARYDAWRASPAITNSHSGTTSNRPSWLTGYYSSPYIDGTGGIQNVAAFYATTDYDWSCGDIERYYGLYVTTGAGDTSTGGALVESYGIRITGHPVRTSNSYTWGLKIDGSTVGGTNNYGIDVSGTGSQSGIEGLTVFGVSAGLALIPNLGGQGSPNSGRYGVASVTTTTPNGTLSRPMLVLAHTNFIAPKLEQQSYQASNVTTDGTITTLCSIPLTNNYTYQIIAEVVARRTGGTSGATNDGASYTRVATYKCTSGTAALIGSVTAPVTHESQAGWDCTLDASGASARVRVTGATNNNVSWGVTLRISFLTTAPS